MIDYVPSCAGTRQLREHEHFEGTARSVSSAPPPRTSAYMAAKTLPQVKMAKPSVSVAVPGVSTGDNALRQAVHFREGLELCVRGSVGQGLAPVLKCGWREKDFPDHRFGWGASPRWEAPRLDCQGWFNKMRPMLDFVRANAALGPVAVRTCGAIGGVREPFGGGTVEVNYCGRKIDDNSRT